MTEEEAKTKWCPFVRQPQMFPTAGGVIVGGCNAQDDGSRPARTNCIGSACMAWRWLTEHNPDYVPADYQSYPAKRAVGNPYLQSTTSGCCGLAGKP